MPDNGLDIVFDEPICPYCEKPVDSEHGIDYGGERLHVACHEQLGRDFATLDESHDLTPELVNAMLTEYADLTQGQDN